jgi:hypothetical protein
MLGAGARNADTQTPAERLSEIPLFRRVVQPTRVFSAGSREYPADFPAVHVLVVAHIKAVIFADVENLNLAGGVRHDVAEGFFDSAEAPVCTMGYFDATSQGYLEV